MIIGMLPTVVFATGTETNDKMRVYHLDCGRKYFTVDETKGLIDELSKYGYNYMELAIGNDGLRMLLDDMSLSYTVNEVEHSFTSDEVRSAIQVGNRSYTTASTGEWSQTQMDEIIAYANNKGISIIPLVNTPGHMDAILHAATSLLGSSMAYNNSVRTIDITNADAVAFTKAVLQKYIGYFSARGSRYFNMGADEYANDQGTGGFSNLVAYGYYDDFINYINDVADMILTAGMTPIAFNDGIRYNGNEPVRINRNIIVSYWSSGWSGYNVSSAANLAAQGFRILNTNGDWYYVLQSGGTNINTSLTQIQSKPWTQVMGSTVSEDSLVGAMICFWCDNPGWSYSATEAYQQISAFAEKNTPSLFPEATSPGQTEAGFEIESLSLTMGNPQSVNFVGLQEGETLTCSADDPSIITVQVEGSSILVTPNAVGTTTLTATVNAGTRAAGDAYTLPVTVAAAPIAADTRSITLEVGETKQDTIEGAYYTGYTGGDDKVTVSLSGTEATESAQTRVTNGRSYYIKSADGQYLNADAEFVANLSDAAEWTCVSGNNGYYLQNGNNYLRYNNNRWTTTTSTSDGTQLYFNNGTFYRTRSGNWWNYTYSNPLGSPIVLSGSDSTTVSFTGVQPGTTTVTVGDVVYNVTVTSPPIGNITAEFWCTNTPVTVQLSSGAATSATVPFVQEHVPLFADQIAPMTGTDDANRSYVFWKAVVLPEGRHQTTAEGNDQTAEPEVVAMMFDGADYYYYYASDPNTPHLFLATDQLVLYYNQSFTALENEHGYVNGTDWGTDGVLWNDVWRTVTYRIVETDGNENEVQTAQRVFYYAGATGVIQNIKAVAIPAYVVYKAEVKTENTVTATYDIDQGDTIPEGITLQRGNNYTVTFYIRPVSSLTVDYFWINAPASVTLPTDANTYASGNTVAVDTSYTDGMTVTEATTRYTFHGWYDNPQYSGDPITEFIITQPTTLYGYWIRQNLNGLRIVAGSSDKQYDGQPLTDNTYTVYYDGVELSPDADGIYIADGIRFRLNDLTISGEITNVGTVANTITGTIGYEDPAGTTFANVMWENGELEVTPKPVIVTAENKEKEYGASDPEFTAIVAGLVDGEPLSLIQYNITRALGEEPGEYTITPAGEVLQGNYTVTYQTGTLTIKRSLYSLCITKQNSDEAPLSGAGFKLYSDEGCTQLAEVYVDAACTRLLSEVTDDSTLWTNEYGQLCFYGLTAGDYYIKEFRTPTGYTLLSAPLKLTVAEDGTVTVTNGNGTYSATVTADKEIQITVTDQKLNTDIPLTGGTGVLLFTIGGVALMAGAVGLLAYRRRRNYAR